MLAQAISSVSYRSRSRQLSATALQVSLLPSSPLLPSAHLVTPLTRTDADSVVGIDYRQDHQRVLQARLWRILQINLHEPQAALSLKKITREDEDVTSVKDLESNSWISHGGGERQNDDANMHLKVPKPVVEFPQGSAIDLEDRFDVNHWSQTSIETWFTETEDGYVDPEGDSEDLLGFANLAEAVDGEELADTNIHLDEDDAMQLPHASQSEENHSLLEDRLFVEEEHQAHGRSTIRPSGDSLYESNEQRHVSVVPSILSVDIGEAAALPTIELNGSMLESLSSYDTNSWDLESTCTEPTRWADKPRSEPSDTENLCEDFFHHTGEQPPIQGRGSSPHNETHADICFVESRESPHERSAMRRNGLSGCEADFSDLEEV